MKTEQYEVETYIEWLERVEAAAQTCAVREIARRRIAEYHAKKRDRMWNRLLIAAVLLLIVAVAAADWWGL